MAQKNRRIMAAVFAIDLALLSIGVFVWLCWTAAASEQGAIGFIFYAPLLFAFTIAGFFLAKYASATVGFAKAVKTACLVLTFYYLTFYASPFIGLGSFPNGVIGGVAKSFKALTGKSPMEWDKGL